MKLFKIILLVLIPFFAICQNEGITPWQMQNARSKNYMIRSGANKEFKYDSIIPYLRDTLGFSMGGGGGGGVSGTFNNVTTNNGAVTAGLWRRYLATQNGTGASARIPYYLNDTTLNHQAEFILNNTIGAARIGIGHTTGNNWTNTYFTNVDAGGLTIFDANRSEIGFATSSSNRGVLSFDGVGNFDYWKAGAGTFGTLPLMRMESSGTFRLPILATTGNSIVLASNNGSLINAVGSATDQVLKWNNTTSSWGVGTVATGPTYTEGNGINILSNVISVETVGNGISAGASGVALNAFMQDIASNTNTGIMVRASSGAAGTSAYRTLTQGTGISISNGNGVAGNPTINNTAPFSPTTSGTTNQILTKTPVGYDWVTPSGGTGTVTSITAGSGISTSAAGLNAQITTSGTLYNVAARVAELSRNGVYSITATAATDNIIDFVTPQVDYANSMTVDPTNDYISVPSGGSQNSTFFYTVTIKPSVTTDISMWVRQGTSTTLMRTLTKQTCPTNQTCTISFSSRGIFNTPATQQYKLILQSSSSANIEVLQGYFTMSGNY